MPFDQATRTKVLLWCDRHCCLCKKQCGVNIEVHHIVADGQGGPNDVENAIPLCFDCHSEVGRYNDSQPTGNKYRPDELKSRREQVYEEFTRHLVPPIHYEVTNALGGGKRQFPDVGFSLVHYGDSLPVKVRSVLQFIRAGKSSLKLSGHYSGDKLWNLNPRFLYSGHFSVPDELLSESTLCVRVSVTIIDQYERSHAHLPIHFVYVKDGDFWYLEA